MAVRPGDLTAPYGELEKSNFASITLAEYVHTWLEQARAKTGKEDAQKAFVYWKAYAWKARREADAYARKNVNDVGGSSKTDTQRQHWQDLASYWKAEFERLTDDLRADQEFEPVVSRR